MAVLFSWWPFFLMLFLAAWGDGWVRRRIRQHSFAYASPLAHALSLRVIVSKCRNMSMIHRTCCCGASTTWRPSSSCWSSVSWPTG
ncbi:DUF4400 domain-containing protein [uncultured Thiodictyon sp.]|uniref:DUF4400 domain-containing protein n=1 Tax=uncultured Thiodictyon sp. TaxID=1846217 RepID=UPI0025FD2AFD|nr:DUF4400 domain-containing protein [uncultured Thiodictyon sp.]